MGVNFQDVAFTYFPNKKKELNHYVLKDINLNIDTNDEFICVVGHTGSGKSTLMQLMNALLLPTTGEIKIDENTIKSKNNKNLKEIRKKIGLVFQFPEYQLFEDTILKDVAFGPTNFKLDNPVERAKDALAKFNIDEKFYERNPYHLSGGEMRKVAISGILASDPEVLILDEPTVGLDPYTKKELINLLQDIHNRFHKTIMIVTHDMNVLWTVATRVILLDNEKIIYDGNKYDLFKNDELVKNHYLDYPDIVKVMKEIKNRLNNNIDPFQEDIQSALKEIERVLK